MVSYAACVPAPDITTYAIGMRTRFRGITQRHGMVWRGPAGWAEWSPFEDYGPTESVPWLHAAREAATAGWPAPRRSEIPVNCTVPAVDPQTAHRIARVSGCRTGKVKVAEPGQHRSEDIARVAAVRDALGPDASIRIDANGGWTPETAVAAIEDLAVFDLEYVEQPCATAEELAAVRRTLRGVKLRGSRNPVPVAADESIRRAEDPYRVAELEAADIAVLKVQPLGGVRRCLAIAEDIGLPVVVSSAVETSIGIRAGWALAAALPTLPYACGLNTIPLLTHDLARQPLVAEDGILRVEGTGPAAGSGSSSDPDAPPAGFVDIDAEALDRCVAPAEVAERWMERLHHVAGIADLEPADLGVCRTDAEQQP